MYNFWEDKLDLKCIWYDAELERRARIEMEQEKDNDEEDKE